MHLAGCTAPRAAASRRVAAARQRNRPAVRTAANGLGPLEEAVTDTVLRRAIREPLAFASGLVAGAQDSTPCPSTRLGLTRASAAGFLKLDLSQEPLRSWMAQTAASAGPALEEDAPPADTAAADKTGLAE